MIESATFRCLEDVHSQYGLQQPKILVPTSFIPYKRLFKNQNIVFHRRLQ